MADYDKLVRPTGQKEWPAKTCRDLALSRPDLKSGVYYIDPNEGTASDAIEVHCNLETGESCVFPSPSEVAKTNFNRNGQKQGYVWYSEMPQGANVSVHLYSSSYVLRPNVKCQ